MRIAESELIINGDGSVFHLHLRPEELADNVILVGDPGRVDMIAEYFDEKEFRHASREFVSVTGKYKGVRMTALSTGIGTDNIDIVMNELDALANIDFETREACASYPQCTQNRYVRSNPAGDSARKLRLLARFCGLRRSDELVCRPRQDLDA